MENKLQIQRALPRSAWEGVIIHENNEPVVEVEPGPRIKKFRSEIVLRKTVTEMLYQAAEVLPDGYYLGVLEGLRTLERQRSEWARVFSCIQEQNPTLTSKEIEEKTALRVARPNPLANHNCGGAVDVRLGHIDRGILDLGSIIGDKNFNSREMPMFSEYISDVQKKNRQILREAMESVGFVWYPGEWWHYCYGDRMWAVYTERKECFYGPLTFE